MSEKQCRKCGISKNLDDFYRQKSTSDGRGSYCKDCNKRTVKDWSKKNPERVAAYQRKTKYGITDKDYQLLLRKQSNACALCKKETKLVVDHDHVTGRVRGLLCHTCNVSIERVCKVFLGESDAYLNGAYGLP